MKSLHVKIDDKLMEKFKEKAKREGYLTLSDFVREQIRKFVKEDSL
jgi:metal-responsive CopG/Arc/MetJ family transcriptional regulator